MIERNEDMKVVVLLLFGLISFMAVLLVWFVCAAIGFLIGGYAGLIVGGGVGGAIGLRGCVGVWPGLLRDMDKW